MDKKEQLMKKGSTIYIINTGIHNECWGKSSQRAVKQVHIVTMRVAVQSVKDNKTKKLYVHHLCSYSFSFFMSTISL